MPAHVDTLALSKALEAAGLSIPSANGAARAIQDIAMKDAASQSDLDKALHTMSVRLGVMLATGFGVSTAIIGVLISLFAK